MRTRLSRAIADPTRACRAWGVARVASHDLRAVTELYDVREPLEATAVGLAACSADAAELRLLQAMVEALRRMPADPALHARENTLFHAQIHRAAHDRFLLKSLRGLHDTLVLLGRTTYIAPDRIAAAMAEHAAIVDAIARRDEAAAAQIARQHVRCGYELRVQLMTASLAASGSGSAQGRAHDQTDLHPESVA
jgi:DNA-binding GntR family transcriptional regulator